MSLFSPATLFVVFVLAALAAFLSGVAVLDRSSRRWGDVLRGRLVLGVPWGTLVVIGFVLAVYLFVQDGITNWNDPVTIPYRAWSYFYPTGMLTASFAHNSSGHLVGNLMGTLAVAPIAEYAWGHYSTEWEAGTDSSSSWYHHPWVRALVVFPLVVIGIGIVTSLFALGPVIGFSGVVYAFAGFAIVRYPIATLVATTTVQGALLTVYRAINSPVLEVTAEASAPSAPSWATIAIQGHALGFFLGFCCALVIFDRRQYLPDPMRLVTALVLFGFAKSLWAIYWFRGGDTYVLFRGLGVIVVLAMALLLTAAAAGSDRPLRPVLPLFDTPRTDSRDDTDSRILELALPGTSDGESARARSHDRIRELASGGDWESDEQTSHSRGIGSGSILSTTTRRGLSIMIVLAVLAALMGPAIPFNVFILDETGGESDLDDTITIDDYSITYAENVENELISVIDIEAFGEDTSIETSGVIVSSAERNIWTDAVSAQRLAFYGYSTVNVGSPGEREQVVAIREGWTPTGGDTVYQISLRGGGEQKRVFESEASQADVTLAGHNVTIDTQDGVFGLFVEDGGDVMTAVPIPPDGETIETNTIDFERDGNAIYGVVDDTRVQVASKESYN